MGLGDFGEKEGLFTSGKLPCVGERSWREGAVPGIPGCGDNVCLGCSDAVCPGSWGAGTHTFLRGCVLYPGTRAWCRDGDLIPSPDGECFWLCHEDHLGQRSGILVPHPGLGSLSLLQGLQVEDGTLQHKANTHPPKRVTFPLSCVLSSEPGGYHMPCSIHSIILPQALQPPW